MFSIESLKKVLRIAKDFEKILINMNTDDIEICISDGNEKIGKVLNVSLMPIVTCCNCSECKFLCYDIKACLQYAKTVILARMRNTILYRRDPEKYFSLIRKKLKNRRKNFYFRWHVAGDIPDAKYFAEMVKIANEFSNFIFWTYTKNYKVVNDFVRKNGKNAIPGNFHIMFSKWDGVKMENPFNFPMYACKLKNGNKDTSEEEFKKMFLCPGNCDVCKAINRGCIKGENTFVHEH